MNINIIDNYPKITFTPDNKNYFNNSHREF